MTSKGSKEYAELVVPEERSWHQYSQYDSFQGDHKGLHKI